METGITEKQQATSMQPSKPSPSSKPEIVKLLTKFAERRQAQVNPSTLLTFADDLSSYQLSDIEKALLQLASVPRREGETAFPEVATIFEAVRGVIRERRAVERVEAERMRQESYRAAALREMEEDKANPEEWQAQLTAAAEKLDLERKPKVIDTAPVMQECPQCHQELPVAPNIRFWSPEELRALADVMEANQEIARVNREKAQAAAAEVVEAVHEA